MQDDIHYLYAPITKRDAASRLVEGAISGADNLDLDRQIVDTAFLRRAVGPWFKFGNIREQHIPTRAVGKAKTLDNTVDGVPVITAKIVDDATWSKIEEGIYSGFSVGIKNARIVKDTLAPNGRIIDGDLVEISVVDHPANPDAKFAICKAASGGGWVDLQSGVVIEEANPDVEKGSKFKEPGHYTESDRDKIDEGDFAGPGKTYPIVTQQDVHDAARLVGKAKDPDQVRDRIKAIARRKGFSLPKDWEDSKDNKKMADTTNDETPTGTDAPPHAPSADATDTKGVSPELEKSTEHAHHHMQDDGFVRNGMHSHVRDDKDPFGMSAPYADHKHCKTCGDDDRVCGHGKGKGMKAADPDTTKAEQNVVQEATPIGGQGVNPDEGLLRTQGNPVMDLLRNAQEAIAAVEAAVGQSSSVPNVLNPTPSSKQPEFAEHVSTPAQNWAGGDMFDLKAAVAEALQELLPDLVQKELGKAFGSSDILTKGATPDTVKAAVISIAEQAAEAAIEPVEKRLETVEALAAPVHGAANTRDVEKAFAGNRDKPAMTLDEIAKMAQKQLTETQRMELTKAAIAEAQKRPTTLFR